MVSDKNKVKVLIISMITNIVLIIINDENSFSYGNKCDGCVHFENEKKEGDKKVLPRFELGLLDSESNVLTTRP